MAGILTAVSYDFRKRTSMCSVDSVDSDNVLQNLLNPFNHQMSDVQAKKRKTLPHEEAGEPSYFNINVGGTTFHVDANTISQYPDTMLASMLSKRWTEDKSNKEIYLDRDPMLFRYILSFYRSGKMVIPHTIREAEMFEEIEFFLLPLEKKDIQYDTESIKVMRKALINFENDYIERLKEIEQRSAIKACTSGLAAMLIERIRSEPEKETLHFDLYHDVPRDNIAYSIRYKLIRNEEFFEAVQGLVEKAGYTCTGDGSSYFEIGRG